MKLIINADDFGMNDSTTKAILDSFAVGAITQTTMIVTGDNSDEAVSLARKSGVSEYIGLHLNLAEGKPLTDEIKQHRLFCDENGIFNRAIAKDFGIRAQFDKGLADAVENEIVAQIEKFLSYGLPLRHCDGHHHFEFITPISTILMPKLKKYGFNTIRRKPWMPIHDFKPHVRTRLSLIPYCFRAWVNRLNTTAGFANWPEFIRYCKRCRNNEWIELMTHPRYVKGALVNVIDFSDESGPYIDEVKNFVKSLDKVQFRTYKDLVCENSL